MIVVHASAIIDLLTRHQGYKSIAEKLCSVPQLVISPVSAMEALQALSQRFVDPSPILGTFLRQSRITQRPVDATQAYWARQGFLTYADVQWTVEDCFAYGAAKALDAPLLFTRGDFAKTDLRMA